MAYLALHHVGLRIGEARILDGVSFNVSQGEVLGLIGPNGSGKTTLLNVLSSFLFPTNGTIHWQGSDITHMKSAQRARMGVGRVFQNFGIFRDMTLWENVLVALEALPKEQCLAMGSLQKVVAETLELVDLTAFAHRKAGSLSGGQMRLLEIARTLKTGKQLFLLDEPTAGVSPKMTQQVAGLIAQLKAQGKTILVVEHDLPFISSICDRVVVLDCGKAVIEGSPASVRKSQELQELYFGADPTT